MKLTHIIILACTSLISCTKFLDEKPDKSLVVPSSITDLQAILDNHILISSVSPFALEIGADDFYLTTADWLARNIWERNAYIWAPGCLDENVASWGNPYAVVYNCNVVLEHLNKIKIPAAIDEENNIRGQALFFRSFSFFNLLQVFSKSYKNDSAQHDWGIALRLDADFNKPTERATLKESYDQLIVDLKNAVTLLPLAQLYKTRPSKIAAYAMLARTYLSMSDYSNAMSYADTALQLQNTLLDYNTLNAAATNPVPLFNSECILHSILITTNTVNLLSRTDSVLFQSYTANDLRRSVFFVTNTDGSRSFKGSYDGSVRLFNGLAIDEMYLIRAECFARAGNITNAMNDLNLLLSKRWKTNTFSPFVASTPGEALTVILKERRKELLMRGLRWTDLRRLNREPAFAVTLKRVVNSQQYLLEPNSLRYVYQIPLDVIRMTGIPQND